MLRKSKRPIMLGLVVLAASAGQAQEDPTQRAPRIDWEDYESVSIIQLIATPRDFDGRKVSIHGFASMRFEEFVVYLTRDDMKRLNGKNGIWLDLAREQHDPGKERRLDGRFVVVFGVFSAGEKGHMAANSGALRDIARIEEVPECRKGSRRPTSPDAAARGVPRRPVPKTEP